VSEPLFEQYKAALRRGHLAAIAGRLDDALDAYGEAARLVPDRALPFASRGTVLHRLDRWPEAAEAFDLALRTSPDDEATLRARAAAREERGMLSGAAEDLERLAFVLDVASRGADAIEAAQKAVVLESTPARTALVARLSDAATRAAGPGARRDATSDVEAELAQPRVVPPTAAETARAEQTTDPAQTWPLVDQPSPHPAPIEGPPPDPDALLNEAAELLEAGNVEGASEKMLTAVLVHRAAGRLDAALDICLELLSIVPGDPHVHLAIANLQLDHGWTALATEKIELLLQLTALTGDTQAEADVHGLASERLRDEPSPTRAGR
jgi:tetratricopeptide (TPR) repeat protein